MSRPAKQTFLIASLLPAIFGQRSMPKRIKDGVED
jgi:hypothetical protein